MPQQPMTQKPNPKVSVPSTWSNSNVDISLDFLGPGMQPPKPSQPTLNMMQHGKHIYLSQSKRQHSKQKNEAYPEV